MMSKPVNPWTTVILTVAAGTAITFFAILNRCPLSMEGGSSGFKLKIEQCSNHDIAQVKPVPQSSRSEEKKVEGD